MINKASDILARALVGAIWSIDRAAHPTTPKIEA